MAMIVHFMNGEMDATSSQSNIIFAQKYFFIMNSIIPLFSDKED